DSPDPRALWDSPSSSLELVGTEIAVLEPLVVSLTGVMVAPSPPCVSAWTIRAPPSLEPDPLLVVRVTAGAWSPHELPSRPLLPRAPALMISFSLSARPSLRDE